MGGLLDAMHAAHNDNPVKARANNEHERLEDFIASGGCNNPLMIQVRDAKTKQVKEEQELIDGFNDCICYADVFKGLDCAVPDEDIGNYTCTKDHEVRYYCSNGNVVGFAMERDLTHLQIPPALYGSDGIKYAECDLALTDPSSGESIQSRVVKGKVTNPSNGRSLQ